MKNELDTAKGIFPEGSKKGERENSMKRKLRYKDERSRDANLQSQESQRKRKLKPKFRNYLGK